MAKKRRSSRSFSESDAHARKLKPKQQKKLSSFHTPRLCGTSASAAAAAAVSHFQALQSCSSSAALVDVLEWLGDAVIEELVGRCLLSQFHMAPLSARVFRNLRLAVVTNRNLAQVYDAMGYAAIQRRYYTPDACQKKRNMKQRADVVEAVVGELVLKLHQRKKDSDNYRAHLDTVIATMLHCYFTVQSRAAKKKGETVLSAKGPLSVALNPFAWLPNEQLDEITGEIIVTDGVKGLESMQDKRSCMSEYTCSKMDTAEPYHHFATRSTSRLESGAFAMMPLENNHILRTSREIFEVFKVYGMAVLSERISLLLAVPHVSLQKSKCSELGTPAKLTRQRQCILSVSNLASSAIALGIVERGVHGEVGAESNDQAMRRQQEEHRLANTLRAFVGFHSAVATTSTAATEQSNESVATICSALYSAVYTSKGEPKGVNIPEREPLVAMMRSIGEARMFMHSKACDNLHAHGERPVAKAVRKRDRESRSVRHCDSNSLENLFETLNKEQVAQQTQPNDSFNQIQRHKRVKQSKPREGVALPAGRVTCNLARFLHRRFLFCLEEIVILFAQRQTEACRAQIPVFRPDLEPCVEHLQFRKWEVSKSTLTVAMRDSFFRLLVHDICRFHAVLSTSRNTQDGTRITQLRLPLHYTWSGIDRRITTDSQARS